MGQCGSKPMETGIKSERVEVAPTNKVPPKKAAVNAKQRQPEKEPPKPKTSPANEKKKKEERPKQTKRPADERKKKEPQKQTKRLAEEKKKEGEPLIQPKRLEGAAGSQEPVRRQKTLSQAHGIPPRNAELQTTPEPVPGLPVAPPRGVLDGIVDNAHESLRVIEAWRHSSSNQTTVSGIIRDIHGLLAIYSDAIEASIQTAQDGYGFSGDAVHLCDMVLNPKTNQEDLRQYIQDMKSKAKLTKERCTHTVNKFREVRKGLNEITKRVPEEVQGGNLRVPLFGDEKKRERDVRLKDAMEEFNVGLGMLSDVINKFADWWVQMEIGLGAVERTGVGLRPGKDKERVSHVREIWLGVKDDYLRYKIKIIQLQDYYPLQIPAPRAG